MIVDSVITISGYLKRKRKWRGCKSCGQLGSGKYHLNADTKPVNKQMIVDIVFLKKNLRSVTDLIVYPDHEAG